MKNMICTLLMLFVLTSNVFGQWTQLGLAIDGEAEKDNSGYSVSLSSDGNRVAIGAPYNDDNNTDAGQVRIFDWNGIAWVQTGPDIDGEAAGDNSGIAVSLSSDGKSVAIGAPYNDGNGSYAGHVRIFEWNGSSWVQKGTDINGETAGDYSGFAVSLSSDGKRIAIGAPKNKENGAKAGHVRIFDWNGTAWVQIGADLDGDAGDDSGKAVSLSSDGNHLAIGAPTNNGGFGNVRIYNWNGTSWVQVGADIDGEQSYDNAGGSVSLSSDGRRVAIGAELNSDGGERAGHVRVYDWTGTIWMQVGVDIDGDGYYNYLGRSVSLSSGGTRVAVGAFLRGGGYVRLYEWNGTNWEQVGDDINGEAEEDWSGYSVSLSSNGSRLAIGAINNDGTGSNAGHVRIWESDLVSNVNDKNILPNKSLIMWNYPNPFNSITTINYYLPVEGNLKISIYNKLGQLVKVLHKGKQTSGKYSVEWNGLNSQGEAVSAGVYLYTIKTETFTKTQKMILQK